MNSPRPGRRNTPVARRYQLIGELMRANNAEVEGVYTPAGAAGLSDRISAAVYEDEAARQKSGSTVVELNPNNNQGRQ